MFRPTSPQRKVFGFADMMDEAKRKRLEKHWSEQYRTHALGLIDEELFAKYFHPDNGRPNASIRMVLSVLLLKEMFDLTDQEALEHLEWNHTWHHAMDITADEAHLCQKTLHNYRVLLCSDDEGMALFEQTTGRLIRAAGLKTRRQRLDSTHIVSNIKILTRLGLFVQTMTQFLTALRKGHPRLCGRIPAEVLERYLDREGYFSDVKSSEGQRRLQQVAQDIWCVVRTVGDHRKVRRMPEWALLERLFREQCQVPVEAEPEEILFVEKVSSDSLQSPADPDATYGHKGKGYEAQLAETCEQDNPFQVVTAVHLNGANDSDQHQVETVLDQTERTCGEVPEQLYADAGYASGENIVSARDRGTELVAPIGSKESEKDKLELDLFEFDATGEQLLLCPAGEVPREHTTAKGGKTRQAWFHKSQCRSCPHRAECPVENRKRGPLRRVLSFTPATVAVAQRRAEQQTPAFKERYKIRSGIEATNSELKRCHGLRKLRVRYKPRVALSTRLKALALNMKRYLKHLVDVSLESDEYVPVAA